MSRYIQSIDYQTRLPSGAHWSLKLRKGSVLKITDVSGNSNVGMLFYNPENLLERYNAPDTLKCQHTFKITQGNCLYSDMGRVFCSVIEDSFGWHDTVSGNINFDHVLKKWGSRDYQTQQNDWKQNGHDSFLVELAKYGLGISDLAANLNWFSKIKADENGNLSLDEEQKKPNDYLVLRFEMDTLVLLHTCPHPYSSAQTYPQSETQFEIGVAKPVEDDDFCMNFRQENIRGFHNNKLYHIGLGK